MIEIKQADTNDISVIESILLDALNWLNEMGQPLWKAEDVKWDALAKSYRIEEFYIASLDSKPAGCFVLLDYDPFFWPDVKKSEALFIHKLAVTKAARKQGIGNALMDYSKEEAGRRHISSVRLDCHQHRDKLRAFYEKQGFVCVDEKTFNGKWYTAFYVFTFPNAETDEERRARIYPVILNEYNPVWLKWFVEEEENLRRFIGTENIARISHIGSTSVPGLMAKPTIDILLEINEATNLDRLKTALPSPEYFYLDETTLTMPTPPPHLMFLKGYLPDGFAEKVYHIHVRYLGDPDELYFRDYLIAHPEIAAEYAALKVKLHKDFEHDRDGYTKAKTAFICEVVQKARNL